MTKPVGKVVGGGGRDFMLTLYMGQTGRKLKTRFREHIRLYKYESKDSNLWSHLLEEHILKGMKYCMKLMYLETVKYIVIFRYIQSKWANKLSVRHTD